MTSARDLKQCMDQESDWNQEIGKYHEFIKRLEDERKRLEVENKLLFDEYKSIKRQNSRDIRKKARRKLTKKK